MRIHLQKLWTVAVLPLGPCKYPQPRDILFIRSFSLFGGGPPFVIKGGSHFLLSRAYSNPTRFVPPASEERLPTSAKGQSGIIPQDP